MQCIVLIWDRAVPWALSASFVCSALIIIIIIIIALWGVIHIMITVIIGGGKGARGLKPPSF